MRERDWLSAHLFYHANLDPLLVDLVAPLLTELSSEGLADRYFFLRYWDGGNHLRLRVLANGGRQAIHQRIIDGSAQFFAQRPAPGTVQPEEYAARAAELAHWEGMAGYALRPYPNNSVTFLPYRREHHRYGNGASIEAVERHFVESSRIALRFITAGTSPARRAIAAFSMVLLAWLCAEPDLGRLAGMVATPPVEHPPGQRFGAPLVDLSAVEAHYSRQKHALRHLAVHMRALACRATPDTADGILAAWAQSVTQLRDKLDSSRPPFPVVDLCAHLVCNRLGVSPVEEGVLRYLAARALTDAFGP